MKPPLLPAETLRRVLRVAKMNGSSVLVISGLFALVSAAGHDLTGLDSRAIAGETVIAHVGTPEPPRQFRLS